LLGFLKQSLFLKKFSVVLVLLLFDAEDVLKVSEGNILNIKLLAKFINLLINY
jgi:hypothetical protein